ncbi:MAG: hypothetical protein RL172_2032 [Bacteroidota bacterium]|jgi:two-component system, OmpR family, response regulator
MKALIIDDEIDICFLLGSILRSKNLQVSYVNSLSEAPGALAEHQPQIVFIDNHLPDGLGADFICQLKVSNPAAKVVMITAYDNYSDRAKAFNNGADTFIPKPFTKDMIYQTVDQLVKE